MARLPSVLDTHDLPLAELCAARLDGELFTIDDGWAPLDEPDLPAFRAAVTALRAPRSLVIERMSAAWVHGAIVAPPPVAQFCVPLKARIAVIGDHRAQVREVRIDDDEIIRFGGVPCTTPVRTAFDLLRDPGLDDDDIVTAVASLAATHPRLAAAVLDRFEAAPRLPHKATALARLDRAEQSRRSGDADAAQPSLTR
ncbi:hypothetical protein ACWEOH_16310 [Agromyces sp. NPDC004153]